MATLSRELRKVLENVVLAARGQAEAGARKALDQLSVGHREPWSGMTSDQQGLRRRLRARGRQLGDRLEDAKQQGVDHLVAECAYEHWHRMLFARFLAECELLIEPVSGVSVSVNECQQLARERNVDWISLASTFAQGMLPQIFRTDDPVLEIAFPQEHRQPLEQLLVSLSSEVFLADDSLGWVYQFWQNEQKNAVNESGAKIGADELPAVTQLFTDDYMVDFLLHNTLGAWWAGRHSQGAVEATSEEQARVAVALTGVDWTYLRFEQHDRGRWTPAAGTFSEWPKAAKDIRLLDPCMGSGHFLVSALPLLVAIRRTDEGLSLADACALVVHDNLFGLEVDPRCTQIGAFNVALAAWKLGGYQLLPPLHIACSGLAPRATEQQWVALATGDERLQRGMATLHALFKDAPVLGSLIQPREIGGDLLEAEFHELQPLLETALAEERRDEAAREIGITARGLAKAAEILAGRFTLVTTNVPYLRRGNQCDKLREHLDEHFPQGRADLATAFIQRCIAFVTRGGTSACVSQQHFLYLGSYADLRATLLSTTAIQFVARLGPRAFEAISGENVTVALSCYTHSLPTDAHTIAYIDAQALKKPAEKAEFIRHADPIRLRQKEQLDNPDCRIGFSHDTSVALLQTSSGAFIGLQNGDTPQFVAYFWEVPQIKSPWDPFLLTSDETQLYAGRTGILKWEDGKGALALAPYARIQGREAWGSRGIAIRNTVPLPATIYTGELYDQSSTAIIPKDSNDLEPLWAFCSSDEFLPAIQLVDGKRNKTNQTYLKVPFDRMRWKQVAAEKYPHGVPKPFSTDPTQWLFSGQPNGSDSPLHVALTRLLGYRWPRQTGSDFMDCPALDTDGLDALAAVDGIICISAIRGEEPAAERLHALLAAAYGEHWSGAKLDDLLAHVGYGSKTIETWLRDGFFEQHCELFQQRPFIWHVWDGVKNGFSALLNYHRLTRANLERVTYAYLGDWIRRQEAAVAAGEAGSDAALVAAKLLQGELKKILEGEPPYDIFVRWKSLTQQAIGWEPDLNDGVRVNIRPFMMASDVGRKGAGVLRSKPGIRWERDRGNEPGCTRDDFPWFWGWDEKADDFAGGSTFDGNRWNDLHYSREFKATARHKKGLA